MHSTTLERAGSMSRRASTYATSPLSAIGKSRPSPSLQNHLSPPFSHSEPEISMPTGSESPEKLPGSVSSVSLQEPSSTQRSSVSYFNDDDDDDEGDDDGDDEHETGGRTRAFFSRSSRMFLSRKSSRTNLSSLKTLEWLENASEPRTKDVQELSRRRRSKYGGTGPRNTDSLSRQSISQPFNFQHLTHTAPTQAKALQQASTTDLVSEFSAIRASQAPCGELKGIKAEDVRALASPTASTFGPPGNAPTGDARLRLRSSPSVDGFAYSSPRLSGPPLQTTSSPSALQLRRFSGRPGALGDHLRDPHVHHQESPTVPEFSLSMNWSSPPASRLSALPLPVSRPARQVEEGSAGPPETDNIAQAVTTPDDSACVLLASPACGLADVPEEEEASGVRTGLASEVRYAKPYPGPRRFSRVFDAVPTKQGGALAARNETGAACTPNPSYDSPLVGGVPFETASALQDSWEDDVDYCYENAMEAEGGLDYQAAPLSPFSHPHFPCPAATGVEGATPVEDRRNGPDGAFALQSPVLPQSFDGARDSSGQTLLFPWSPGLLIPNDFTDRLTHEERYGYALSAGVPKSPYQMFGPELGAGRQRDYSPRSSKRISHESVLTSSRTSTISDSKHGASSSVSSIPELIPSRNSRERSMLLADEQLALEIAALDVYGGDVAGVPSAPCWVPRPDEGADSSAAATTTTKWTSKKSAAPACSSPSSFATHNQWSGSDSAGQHMLGLAITGSRSDEAAAASGRARAASLASGSLRTAKPMMHKKSYSLFPTCAAR